MPNPEKRVSKKGLSDTRGGKSRATNADKRWRAEQRRRAEAKISGEAIKYAEQLFKEYPFDMKLHPGDRSKSEKETIAAANRLMAKHFIEGSIELMKDVKAKAMLKEFIKDIFTEKKG